MQRPSLASVTSALTGKISRRRVATTGGAGLTVALTASMLRQTSAQDATPESTPDPLADDTSFLFVQSASSGTFTANPAAGTPSAEGISVTGGGADYLLTLEGHTGNTVYFSDRPERIFGQAPTEQFLDGLGFAPANPPNAALVVQSEAGEDVVVLELIEPSYDAGSGTVTYGANILSDYQGEGLAHLAAQQQDETLAEQFTGASLFIDDCPNITSCYIPGYPNACGCLIIGDVPGGPYGQCWDWSKVSCQPCRNYGDLAGLCNQTYSNCRGSCIAG